MFGLAIGVSSIGESLPRPAYAVLSGLNAATVGIIALAAVQLAQKAITDKLTRLLVFLAAAAGLLYNALWYFPILMLACGIISVVYDFRWLNRPVKAVGSIPRTLRIKLTGRRKEPDVSGPGLELAENQQQQPPDQDNDATASKPSVSNPGVAHEDNDSNEAARTIPTSHQLTTISWPFGLGLILAFLVSFIIIVVLRGVLHTPTLLYRLFANMYLAGTIIFGGGPVVIPLLREYVVVEGWVSSRDFLIGLALIQGFPGPNFNFAVVCHPMHPFLFG
jgi:chromate transport protein ChrA